MKRIKDLFFVFVCVTTCVVFVTAVYITIFWPQVSLGVEILWQILGVSCLSSFGICLYTEKERSTKSTLVRYILHYVYTNAVVLGCGVWFGWFYADNFPMVLGMVLVIALVFLLVSAIVWNKNKKMAALMNERLKGYQQE